MSSSSNGARTLDKLVSTFERQGKRTKHNRTLSLDSTKFLELQSYCKEKGIPVSEVVDKLIGEFLEALREAP